MLVMSRWYNKSSPGYRYTDMLLSAPYIRMMSVGVGTILIIPYTLYSLE